MFEPWIHHFFSLLWGVFPCVYGLSLGPQPPYWVNYPIKQRDFDDYFFTYFYLQLNPFDIREMLAILLSRAGSIDFVDELVT